MVNCNARENKFFILALMAVISASLVLSGCGSNKGLETENSTPQPVSTPTQSVVPDVSSNIKAVEPTYTLTDTGQTKCYDNEKEIPCPKPGEPFYGQDGNYQGSQPDYQDNGGTITDAKTGLVWEQYNDQMKDKKNWQDATDYCQNLKLGGGDWRLPTRSELMSINNYGFYEYSVDQKFKLPSVNSHLDQSYWSSDGYNRERWLVEFTEGESKWADGQNNVRYVRCVKGNQFQKGKFQDNGDGTITDLASGLVWQKNDNEPKSWEEALSACESIGWRLPNIRELESITDTTNVNPWNPIFNARGGMYWSSTSVAKRPGLVWVTTANLQYEGLLQIDNASKDIERLFFRCVRDGSTESAQVHLFPLDSPGCKKIVDEAVKMKNSGCQYCDTFTYPDNHMPTNCNLNKCNGNPGYTDCSNFCSAAYEKVGCASPGGSTAALFPKADTIPDRNSLKAGDLIVRNDVDASGIKHHHVVMCEDDGCTKIIHAAYLSINIQEVNTDKYGVLDPSWKGRWIQAGKYCGDSCSN